MADEEGVDGEGGSTREEARGADRGYSAPSSYRNEGEERSRDSVDDREERNVARSEGARIAAPHLDDSNLRDVEDILDGEFADEKVAAVPERIEHWEGPLPPPAALDAYESVVRGAASRVIAMAEKQLQIRETREETVRSAVESESYVQRTLADADSAALRRGQYLATIMSISVAILACIGMFLTPWAAVGFAVPIGQVAVTVVRTVTDGRRTDSPGTSQGSD